MMTMYPAKKRELRHDRHTLLADHLVITPEYRGKILICEVDFVTEAGTCADMGMKIMIKGRSSRILRQEFPHLKEWCGEHL